MLRLPKGHQYSYFIFFVYLVLSLFVRNSIYYIFFSLYFSYQICSNLVHIALIGYVIEMRFCIKFIGQWLHLNRWWHWSLSLPFAIPAESCECIGMNILLGDGIDSYCRILIILLIKCAFFLHIVFGRKMIKFLCTFAG